MTAYVVAGFILSGGDKVIYLVSNFVKLLKIKTN